jgi:hypothetical protein
MRPRKNWSIFVLGKPVRFWGAFSVVHTIRPPALLVAIRAGRVANAVRSCTGQSYESVAASSPARPRCGDSITEREFPSDKVYRRDDRGIVGVESFSAEGLAFFVIHTSVGRAACRYGSQFVHGRCGP